MKRIHHIGYLVKDIQKSTDKFKDLGYVLIDAPYFDEYRSAFIAFMQCDALTIELISPLKDSLLYEMMAKYRNVAYHICYIVDDIQEEIDILKTKGYLLVRDIERADAIDYKAKVAFMMHSDIGMIELLETK